MIVPLLIPLIYPADFDRADRVAARLVAALSDSPFVVLGWHQNGQLLFAPATLDFAAEREQVLRNLRARPNRAPWFEATIAGPKRRSKALLRVGDRTTASDLFDVEFLLEAAARLGAEEVFVAAPTQQSMLLTADRGLASHLCLTRLHALPHAEFVIGSQIFRCDPGGLSLAGVARRQDAAALVAGSAESAGQAAGNADERREPVPPAAAPGVKARRKKQRTKVAPAIAFDAESPESENDEGLGYMPMGLQVGTDDGEFMVVLAMTEPDFASAARKIDLLLARRLPRFLQNPQFSGGIRFLLNPEFVRPTAKNRERFAAIIDERSREFQQLRLATASGKPLVIAGSIGAPGEPDAPEPAPGRESERATNEAPADEQPALAALAEIRRLAAAARAGKTVAIETSGNEAPRVKAARIRAEQAEAVRAEAARVEAARVEAERAEAARADADPLVQAARAAARQLRGERLVMAGALLTTTAVTARYVLALFLSGSALLGQMETLLPFACLLLFALSHFGYSYGRFGLLALAALSVRSTVWRWEQSQQLDTTVWLFVTVVTTGMAFFIAAVCLVAGRTRGKPPALTGAAVLRAALGLTFGSALFAASGLAELSFCFASNKRFEATGSCALLPAGMCASAVGCKVIEPSCVTVCGGGHSKACTPPCESVDGSCRPICSWEPATPWSNGPVCGPRGLCTKSGDQCVDSCSITSPAECKLLPFCELHECAGTTPLSCVDYPADKCPSGICSSRWY